jgi:predicted SnoaL-like aldol condensation-catalyzing enzyme
MGDGVSEFLTVLNEWKKTNKEQVYTAVRRVLGDGNFVLVLSEGFMGVTHSAFYDLYRIKDQKIIEHWDVIEAITPTENRKNNNGKF